MISPDYCLEMARYNQWQNNGLRKIVKAMSDEDLRADRGAFFGSILRTLNHVMWGDILWLARFDPDAQLPELADKGGVEQTANASAWSSERFRVDGQIVEWARGVTSLDLSGNIRWTSKTYKTDFDQSKALCITHFFNHQTHHRGQVHAMLTAAGQTLIDTDLVLMPET